jgi:hypothetical protein
VRAPLRVAAAIAAGLVVGLALMASDRSRDAEWAVTANQIADARAYGKPGVEIAPGRFVTEPERRPDSWKLPVKWVLAGAAAACAVLVGTGLRPRP